MLRLVIGFLAVFAVFPASAQIVFKCVDWRGHATYQSEPCPPRMKGEKAWVALPDAPLTDAEAQRRIEAAQSVEADRRYMRQRAAQMGLPVASGATVGNRPQSYACEAAKANRAAVLEAVGLKRTYELLQRLDDAVNRACK